MRRWSTNSSSWPGRNKRFHKRFRHALRRISRRSAIFYPTCTIYIPGKEWYDNGTQYRQGGPPWNTASTPCSRGCATSAAGASCATASPENVQEHSHHGGRAGPRAGADPAGDVWPCPGRSPMPAPPPRSSTTRRRFSPATCPPPSNTTTPTSATPTTRWRRPAPSACWSMLPPALRAAYQPLLTGGGRGCPPGWSRPRTSSPPTSSASRSSRPATPSSSPPRPRPAHALEAMLLPELDWFMTHCLAAFSLNLDELNG